MDKAQIIKALPRLSADDLHEVNVLTKHLLGQAEKNAPAPALRAAYDALTAALGVSMPYKVFAKSATYRQWTESAPDFEYFIAEHFPGTETSKALKNAVFRFIFKIQISYLKDQGIPVNIPTMVNTLPQIPNIFERAFPSYTSLRMCDLITTVLKRKTPK